MIAKAPFMAHASATLGLHGQTLGFFSLTSKGLIMSLLKNLVVLCLIGFFLTACGDGGLFGNTPGPKKPAWASQTADQLIK